MSENPVQKSLHEGRAAVGTWLTLCSPAAAEQMAHVGWDWLVVEVEHSPVGFETMANCFRAIQLGGAVPMARIPWNDTIWIQRTLDAGALGLVIPMVNSRADAEAAVANCHYAPRGQRSYGGIRIRDYVDGDYFAWAAANISVIPMIETIQAVEKADEILSVEGVDGCFIGPSDLALSMGIKPGEGGPGTAHEQAIQHVLQVGKRVGTAVGKHCVGMDEANERIAQGFQFLAVNSDSAFMVAEAKRQWGQIVR
jgi:4-hydroxy-2-oxoheptanedioate aldolase